MPLILSNITPWGKEFSNEKKAAILKIFLIKLLDLFSFEP